jgi:transcriptional regulator with XRE-family HTH domain
VDPTEDPRQLLARRLRRLREEHWRDLKITQTQLAGAMGVSVPSISSWESASKPKLPPVGRLADYAKFFATKLSVRGECRLPDDDELTTEEHALRDALLKELKQLRSAAMRGLGFADEQAADGLGESYYRFADDKPITIVAAQLPEDMLAQLPHSDPGDPHYVALAAYADLDALFELHGHIRAANPVSEVHVRSTDELSYQQSPIVVGRVADHFTTHLVLLGGVERNPATRSVVNRLKLPIRQVADWSAPEKLYFEIEGDEGNRQFRPVLERSGDREILLEDVALFIRAVNPFNKRRTVTICNGMYGSGTFGAVRALTDSRFRDRNTEYALSAFGGINTFCILMRVTVENGVPMTPDWTNDADRLFEWSSES